MEQLRMTARTTSVKDVYIIEPRIFGDHRGRFFESWSKAEFEKNGLDYDYIQDNQSFSAVRWTLRGLHFQRGEYSQAKLVRCVKGAILDVAVDLRHDSPTYKQHVKVVLSEENHHELVIPRGFAHGFLTLTDEVEFLYRVDNVYAPDHEASIRFDDPELGIDWGLPAGTVPVMKEQDAEAPFLKDYGILF